MEQLQQQNLIVELEIVIIILQVLSIPVILIGKAWLMRREDRKWKREDLQNQPKG
jgi:prolipoprotein diacylglyceryltransferase